MAKAPATLKIKLLSDSWIGTERHRTGMVVDFPFEFARQLLDEGKAERADPLPGTE